MLAIGPSVHLYAFNVNLENAQSRRITVPKVQNIASFHALSAAQGVSMAAITVIMQSNKLVGREQKDIKISQKTLSLLQIKSKVVSDLRQAMNLCAQWELSRLDFPPLQISIIISIMHSVETSSSEEFCIELTQQLIESPKHQSRISLQYTESLISIKNQLQQSSLTIDCSPSISKRKQLGYTTTSTRHTISEPKSTFNTFRLRAISYNSGCFQKHKKILTVRNFAFQQAINSKRKGTSSDKIRFKKSLSAKQRRNSENSPFILNTQLEEKIIHIEEFTQNMTQLKIKSIRLETNTARDKKYLKKIIQSRASILHLSEEGFKPLLRKKALFRA